MSRTAGHNELARRFEFGPARGHNELARRFEFGPARGHNEWARGFEIGPARRHSIRRIRGLLRAVMGFLFHKEHLSSATPPFDIPPPRESPCVRLLSLFNFLNGLRHQLRTRPGKILENGLPRAFKFIKGDDVWREWPPFPHSGLPRNPELLVLLPNCLEFLTNCHWNGRAVRTHTPPGRDGTGRDAGAGRGSACSRLYRGGSRPPGPPVS